MCGFSARMAMKMAHGNRNVHVFIVWPYTNPNSEQQFSIANHRWGDEKHSTKQIKNKTKTDTDDNNNKNKNQNRQTARREKRQTFIYMVMLDLVVGSFLYVILYVWTFRFDWFYAKKTRTQYTSNWKKQLKSTLNISR